MTRTRLFTLLLAAIIAGCVASGPDEAAPGHDDAHAHETHEGESVTTWIGVQRPSDASLLELPARVVAAADSRARLDTPLHGSVVTITARVGDRVEAGDAIVELRIPAVLEAAAILAGTGSQLGSQKARRERLEELRAAGLVGAAEVFDIESNIGRLSAERRLALATLTAMGIDDAERGAVLRRGTVLFRAPIAGVVAQIDAVPGEVVESGETLAQILGRAPARIEVTSAGELAQLGEATTSLEFEGLDGSRIPLASTPVATAVEPGLGRMLAWYETADPTLALADGVRGRVLLRSDDPRLLEVPRRSLRLDDGRAWVGRRNAAGEVEMVEVEVLRSVGSSALIRSAALNVGDSIAANAATVLMLGRDPAELGGGGHAH